MNNQFSTVSLEELIDNCTNDDNTQLPNNIDSEIETALTQYDKSDIAAKVTPELQGLVKKSGESIDHEKVYTQLAKLIEVGNEVLANLSSFEIDPGNTETITATASLLNSIRNVVSEFTKIHQQHVKFQQAIEMEKMKFIHRQELVKMRAEMYAAAKKSAAIDTPQLSPNTLIEVTDNDIINYVRHKKEQDQPQNSISLSDDLV